MNSINPATEETVATYPDHTESQVLEVLAKAAEAGREWRKTSMEHRAQLLHKTAQGLRKNLSQLARTITSEMGKPIGQAEAEVEKCAVGCEHYATHGAVYLANDIVKTDADDSYIAYEPLGVVLAIMPWNFPFWQAMRFAAPTLMAGNVCVLKHAPNVPGCALAIERVLREGGFPAGAFTALLVDVPVVESIIRHPAIAAVTLTGSSRAGMAVAAQTGKALKKCVLELGGSDPFIVLEDVDVEATAKAAVGARTLNSGQSCIAAKRFIVVGDAGRFAGTMADVMSKLKVGDPLDRTTDVGPIARKDLLEHLESQVERSIAAGARPLVGGHCMGGKGFYYAPTVLADVKPGMPAFDEEIFGPVAAVVSANNVDEAIELANRTEYGLGASIWTRDVEWAKKLVPRIESGSVFINGMVKSDARLPFGGVKHSGYGRELARQGMLEFVNVKTVWIRKS
jgi:succinate-semialdehyde dehydrogenase/glutarate-semialdehyde dehydrogenase